MKNSNSPTNDFDMVSKEVADKGSPDQKGAIDKSPGALGNTNSSLDEGALFQKHYSKELKVNEDEIPFVLAEFTENALRYIK